MKYLRKLHARRAAAGMEWKILRKLPLCLVGGVVVPLLLSAGGRLYPPPGPAHEVAKQLTSLDIFSIAVGSAVWVAVITVAFGCMVVVVMKGPAYVADGYSPDDPKYQPDRARDNRESLNT